MAGGRPPEYSPKKLKAAKAFAETAKKMALSDKQGKAPPKIAELALVLGVARSTIYEWKRLHPEFSDTIEDIQSAAEIMLVDNGLGGTYNPTITKLMLSSNHDYKERQDVTSADKAVTPMLVRFLGENEQPDSGNTERV